MNQKLPKPARFAALLMSVAFLATPAYAQDTSQAETSPPVVGTDSPPSGAIDTAPSISTVDTSTSTARDDGSLPERTARHTTRTAVTRSQVRATDSAPAQASPPAAPAAAPEAQLPAVDAATTQVAPAPAAADASQQPDSTGQGSPQIPVIVWPLLGLIALAGIAIAFMRRPRVTYQQSYADPELEETSLSATAALPEFPPAMPAIPVVAPATQPKPAARRSAKPKTQAKAKAKVPAKPRTRAKAKTTGSVAAKAPARQRAGIA